MSKNDSQQYGLQDWYDLSQICPANTVVTLSECMKWWFGCMKCWGNGDKYGYN